jgi:hypothetical protein
MSHPASKIALVTNAEAARPIAVGLAARGATVVLSMADEERAAWLALDVSRQTGNPNVHPFMIDLASLDCVRRGARVFIERYRRLHVLVTDTLVPSPWPLERLGPFLLASLLLDTMKQSGSGRIIRLPVAGDRRQIWSSSSPRAPECG